MVKMIRLLIIMALLSASLDIIVPCVSAQSVTLVHVFGSNPNDPNGSGPQAGVADGKDGYLYGTTTGGGKLDSTGNTRGVIFRVKPDGTEYCVLALFNGSDAPVNPSSNPAGYYPTARLLLGKKDPIDGNFYLYGTTSDYVNRSDGKGTIFRFLRPASGPNVTAMVQTLAVFTGSMAPPPGGASATEPQSVQPNGLMQRSNPNDNAFYGSTYGGTVFKMTLTGAAGATSASIQSYDYIGAPPGTTSIGTDSDAIPLDIGDGNLYYTFLTRPKQIYCLPAAWNLLSIIPYINGNPSFLPLANVGDTPQNLVLGKNGMIYGTTGPADLSADPNPSYPNGTIFQINSTTWNSTTTSKQAIPIAFIQANNNQQQNLPPVIGYQASPNLLFASDGNLYGTTSGGTANGSAVKGTLFQITPPTASQSAGKAQTLFTFGDPNDPSIKAMPNPTVFDEPYDGLIEDDDPMDTSHLNFYGTAFHAPLQNYPNGGVIYKLQVPVPTIQWPITTGPVFGPCRLSAVAWYDGYRIIYIYPIGEYQDCLRFIPQPIQIGDPVEVTIETFYVSPEWTTLPQIRNILALYARAGENNAPLYLLSELQKELKAVNLGTKLEPEDAHVAVKQISNSKNSAGFLVSDFTSKEVSLKISGKLPKTAKPGDTYLALISAHYKKFGNLHSRDTHFAEIFEVERGADQK